MAPAVLNSGTTAATPRSDLPAVQVFFVRNSIYKPSYGQYGFRLTARLLACCLCYYVCCRSRRKSVPWSRIVMAAPVLVCDRPLGVVDGRAFTVMGRLAGLLPSRTFPPRSSATRATAELSLTCRARVRQSSSPASIASMSGGRTSYTPLFCSYNRTDHAYARHPRTGAQVRALARRTRYTALCLFLLVPALVRRTAQTARRGFPQARFHPRERFWPQSRFWPRAGFWFRPRVRSRRV